MPMLSNAFQRLRVGAAVQLRRLSYQCPCFSMHLPRAALFCAFARPLAANPTQCGAYPSNSNAFLRSATAKQRLSSLRHRQSMRFFSIAEHSLATAERICSAAPRSFAPANLSAVARSLSIANLVGSELFHCASARCTSMQFLGNSRHCHAVAVVRNSSQCRCHGAQFRRLCAVALSWLDHIPRERALSAVAPLAQPAQASVAQALLDHRQ